MCALKIYYWIESIKVNTLKKTYVLIVYNILNTINSNNQVSI